MSNSSLISYTKITHKSNPRQNTVYNPTGKITKITIHHMSGNATIESVGEWFAGESSGSSNYGVGTDGRIAMYVEENRRAWTSSNKENDYQAVTIEVANNTGAPDWKVSDKALESTIALCVDICRRNGIAKLNYTGDKTGNLTMHKWFANTDCPGPYLESKFPYIAQEVNRRLNGDTTQQTDSKPQNGKTFYRVVAGSYENKANAEAQMAKLKALGVTGCFIAPYFVEGETAPVTPPAKTVDELAREVIQGKHGNGEERKKSLGSMYQAVQKRVDELMK